MRSVKMHDVTCWCGTPFSVPEQLFDAAFNRGHTIYCPHGHGCHWRETEADKMRRRAERAEQQIAHWQEEAERAERSATAYKGQVTRLKKRAKAGVCPCCTRHFENLERHIKTKHPDMSVDADLTVIEGGKSASQGA